jgi:hypothetical protein
VVPGTGWDSGTPENFGKVPTSNMVPSAWYHACQSRLAQQRSFERGDNVVDE